ncbi:response regulator transcription factor [Streptomyces sp. NPDC058469]|uniref:helix-turn-helix transcriptional regulator n=1 Tax=Streptomyces sp. NPDC058469 TaxID=3346514 RepID=UPI003648C323
MQWTNRDSGATDALRARARSGPTGLVLATGGRWTGPRDSHLAARGPMGRDSPRRQLTLALRSDDAITADGAAAFFQSGPHEVRLVPAHLQEQSEVLLILVGEVTDETMSWMRRSAVGGAGARSRIVLVADSITENQLLRAVSYGLTSFLHRHQVGFAQVLRAVVNSCDGRAELPETLVASLVEQLREAQERGGSDGLSGLTPREAEVLRHLADGLDTAEIASSLSYSERTIKNIIHGVISRFGLRNRAHAVAHGIRTGLI